MKRMLILLIILMSLLPTTMTSASGPVHCVPDINIMYADFDEVIAQVFIPQDCPIAGDGTLNPLEQLQTMSVTLERKSVAPGGSFELAPVSQVAIALVDVTTITTVHNRAYLIKNVYFTIVPSYTTTDYHRVVVTVSGKFGKSAFTAQDASIWLSMPPAPPTPFVPGGYSGS